MRKSKKKSGVESAPVKKKSKGKRIALIIAMVLLFVVGVSCLYVSYLLNQVDRGELSSSMDDLGIDTSKLRSDGVINIALFGVDSREDTNTGRSDSIMVASFDITHHKLKLVSLMRDSQVAIDGIGDRKINHAYAAGGPELAVKTINQNFGLDITDYVSVNFYQLADVIDSLGGLDIDITEAERKNANFYIKEAAAAVGRNPEIIPQSGPQHMSGQQVVAYGRIRYVGNSDFQRTERQREVLEKVFNKMLEKNLLEYPGILNTVLPMIETSMTNSEILNIGARLVTFGKPKMEQGRFPLDGSYTSKGSNLVYDLEEASNKLHRFIYDDEPFYEEKEKETAA